MRKPNTKLIVIDVEPCYLFNPGNVRGIYHYTTIERGFGDKVGFRRERLARWVKRYELKDWRWR